MDIEEIKTLTDLMVNNDLSEIMIRDGEKRIVIRRGQANAPYAAAAPVAPVPAVILPPPGVGAAPQAAQPSAAAPAKEDPNLAKIKSPMVGTFYAAPDPESPPFVRVGDVVAADTTIAIIEAMKVFNEIKAEVAGTIESVLVQNAEPVEFGQVLMTVRVG
jgi:acetyl-CoA carboxylase biotin carboxyl carrier protein